MQPFTQLTTTALPMRRENVDTDQIIPARYLTAVTKAGMGDGLFSWWRYGRDGKPNPDFELNKPEYSGSQILIAGRNFGSGSSREHAVWALTEYGFRAVIAPGFADIFYNNSLKNGLLPVVLPEETVQALMQRPDDELVIDVATRELRTPGGAVFAFPLDAFAQTCLLEGVDELGYLLARHPDIERYEATRHAR